MSNGLEKTLSIISRAWGRLEGSGYVFFPWIDREVQREEGIRSAGYHEGPAFWWPRDKAKILEHMAAHTEHDLYWCPMMFDYAKRKGQFSCWENALWADLDEVDPRTIDHKYEPSIAWETSPGRYQALWIINIGDIPNASWEGMENQRLTYYLGADPSGWDTTQLLRVPGWTNHKLEYRNTENGSYPKGKLLWDKGRVYEANEFGDLPEVEGAGFGLTDVVVEEVEDVDRFAVLARIRLKLTKRIREFLNARETSGDRSSVLWEIERSLADVGCTVAEIVAVVRGTVWNKYTNRSDELKRLILEAAKAVAQSPKAPKEPEDDEDNISKIKTQRLAIALATIKKPKWLIKDILTEGGVGFIAGEPKAYKSWVGLDMMFSVATGSPFLDCWPVREPGPVLYIQEEDPPTIIKDRVGKIWSSKRKDKLVLGNMPGEVLWLPSTNVFDPDVESLLQRNMIISDEAWQLWLDDRLAKGSAGVPFKLVIIDTLMQVSGDVDENRSLEMTTKILKPLKLLMRKHKAALQIVHHLGKNADGRRSGLRLLGSTANHAWSEDSIFLQPMDNAIQLKTESKSVGGNTYRLDGILNHYGWKPIIGPWSKAPVSLNGKITINGAPPAPGTGLAKLLDIVLTASQPLTSLQIANALGYAQTGYTHTNLKRLAERGLITSFDTHPKKWWTP